MENNKAIITAENDFVSFYNNYLVKAFEDYVENGAIRYSYIFTQYINSPIQRPYLSLRCKGDGKFNVLRFNFTYDLDSSFLLVNASILDYHQKVMSSGNMEYYNGNLSDFKAAKIELIIDKALEELQLELI